MSELRTTDPVIRVRRSELLRSDSYGVHGSDFLVCKLCEAESGAGKLRKPIEHKADCPLGRYEARAVKRAKVTS